MPKFPKINQAAVARLACPQPIHPQDRSQSVGPSGITSLTILASCMVAPGVEMSFPVYVEAVPGGWRSRAKRKKWSPVCRDVIDAIQAEAALNLAEVEAFRAPDGSIPTTWGEA